MTARQLAFEVLMKMHRGGYSNISLDAALDSAPDLDARDRALASNLVYGVTERRITLDFQLAKYLDRPIRKLRPEVLAILRMGAYQLLFTDRIPDSAAVNESVKLARTNGCPFAASMVNAVLRKVGANGLLLPAQTNMRKYLTVKYSCEDWIVALLLEQYGENAEKVLSSSLCVPKLTVRVNTLKVTADELIASLESEGIAAEKSYIVENAVNITKSGISPDRLKSFKKGLFHVQDAACQLCCETLEARPGQTVLDLCSAPGGKAVTIAEIMGNKGVVKAFDIYPHKTKLIDDAAKRLGTDIVVSCVNDATVYRESLCGADRVLCDVPCSGLGIMARKPEIKYKSFDEIKDLPDIQYAILSNGAGYVAVGGRIVYSTCTFVKAENEGVCDRFLKEHTEFKKVGEYVTLLPGVNGCDGFFYAVFERGL